MGIKEQLDQDLRDAMRAGNTGRRDAIRLARNAIRNAEIARMVPSLDDQGVIEVLSKEVKQRRESILEYRKGNRPDLADKEQAEINVLQDYLPEQLSREQIAEQARKVIQEIGARGPADKGKVMSKLMPLMKGKADGRDVNEVVADLLK